MKQTFDTDKILFQLLNGSTELKSVITGGVYIDERPFGSSLEDVVVNTIALTQEYAPQLGTSNVNIHVSDMDVLIGGTTQKKVNRERLHTISEIVMSTLRASNIEGLSLTVTGQTKIAEPEINQHYVNIRVDWVIH